MSENARDTIRGYLAQAMRGAMHLPPPKSRTAPATPTLEDELSAPGLDEEDPYDRSYDSWVENLTYNPKTRDLVVTLKGVDYLYPKVPLEVFEAFRDSDDVGDFYMNEFNPNFDSQ